MVFKKNDVDAALTKKGFVLRQSDHSFFTYVTKDGKKSIVRTKTSHGNSGKDIDDGLIRRMATQCKLTNGQFKDLINCPLSRDEYEEILVETEII